MKGYQARERFQFRWNSRIHVVLMYGKMTRQPFSLEDLVEFSTMFKMKGTNIVRDINRTAERGYLSVLPDGRWQITESGIDIVYAIAQSYREINPVVDDEEELEELATLSSLV